ncbi:MAG: recombinase family protein [Corynebacterium sp.]|nr:recombinase family protein [Corynebacterium sp.]
MYTLYLDGGSLTGIAKQLQAEGHLTASGNPNWSAHQVRSILTNEKYKGDALFQKSCITDFLTKKQVKNEGEVPQYYVTGNHEPIIAPAVWDFVQAELAAPATGRRSSSRQRTFSGKIRCAQCGAWYGSKTWHAGTKYEKRIWRCNHKYAGTTPCSTPHVSDEQITTAFLDAVHHLLASRDQVDELVDQAVRAELDTTDLHIEADQLFARVGAAAEAIDQLIARNARIAQDQGEYQRRFDKLTSEHATLLEEYHRLLNQISDLNNRQAAYCHYQEELDKLDIDHIKFTPYLWHTLVDHAEVGTDSTITFTFRDGAKQTQPLER